MSQKLYFQCLFGIQCRNFVMIAADRMDTESFLVMKDDVDKLYELADNIVLGVNGDSGEMAQLTEFIAKNLQLYKMRNKYELSVPAVAHFTRKSLTDVLRTGTSYTLNLMLAGYDEKTGGHLYTMDMLAACMKVPYATHGLGGLLTLGIMDQYYKPGLTEPEAYEVLKMCIREVQLRLLMNLPHFKVKTVSRHGVLTLPDINSTMLLQK